MPILRFELMSAADLPGSPGAVEDGREDLAGSGIVALLWLSQQWQRWHPNASPVDYLAAAELQALYDARNTDDLLREGLACMWAAHMETRTQPGPQDDSDCEVMDQSAGPPEAQNESAKSAACQQRWIKAHRHSKKAKACEEAQLELPQP